MKNLYLTFSLLLIFTSLAAQNFNLMGIDSSGDNSKSHVPDITEVWIATDPIKDSLWLNIELAQALALSSWGFEVVFDTNSVVSDGTALGPLNRSGNDSLKYEMRLTVSHSSFTPPAFMNLYGSNGSTRDVGIVIAPDRKTVTFAFKLHHIGRDGDFNFVVYGSTFETIMHDAAPSIGYYSVQSGGSGGSGNPSTHMSGVGNFNSSVNISPNPSSTFVNIKSGESINTVSVYSIAGEQINVPSARLNNREVELSINDLPTGIYIATVRLSGGEVITRKLIKD